MTKLDGMIILDLSRILAGPLCSMMLGDLGATVIKIESLNGDDTRTWGPPFFPDKSEENTAHKTPGESAYYLSVNRNKKSLALDFSHTSGKSIVQALAQQADVVIENFRPGSLKKYGLDYQNISQKNPRVVYCSITGYGQFGEKSLTSGYDFIIQGESGFMAITGDVQGEPMKVGVAICDVLAGYNACIGILAALLRRQKTGQGELIDISLLDCSLASLVNVASNVLVNKAPARRFGNHHPNIVPYGSFLAQDRTFNLAIGNDRQFEDFARLTGKKEWTQADQYASNRQRVEKRESLIQKINEVLQTKPAMHWIQACKKNRIPAGLVCSLDETLASGHSQKRKMTRTLLDHPYGKLDTVSSPIFFQNEAIEQYTAPPLLGEHSEQILKEQLAMPQAEIRELLDKKIIFQNSRHRNAH